MRIAYWFRVAAPFFVGCFAGLCLALGTLVAVRAGIAEYDGDRGYFVALIWVAACWIIGGGLVIFNGMEWYRK